MLILYSKNSKEDGGGGGVTLTSSRKDWAEFYGCIKDLHVGS